MIKKRLLTTGPFALGLLVFAAQAGSAEIAGSVTDTQNHPVASAQVSVKDQAGNVVGKADADNNGHYSIGGIATGEYSVSLTLPGTKYQGQTVETGVPPEGLCIYWMVSQSASALATGRPGVRAGTCTPSARRSAVPEGGRFQYGHSGGHPERSFPSGEFSGERDSAMSAVVVSGIARSLISCRPNNFFE